MRVDYYLEEKEAEKMGYLQEEGRGGIIRRWSGMQEG